MASYIKDGFLASRTLGHILNIYLRNYAVILVYFKELCKLVMVVKNTEKLANKHLDWATLKIK